MMGTSGAVPFIGVVTDNSIVKDRCGPENLCMINWESKSTESSKKEIETVENTRLLAN